MSDEEQYAYRRKTERIINGEIVTDSKSDNPELYYKEQEKALRKLNPSNTVQREDPLKG